MSPRGFLIETSTLLHIYKYTIIETQGWETLLQFSLLSKYVEQLAS